MWARCRNPNRDNYKYYGGRGIKVCRRWESYLLFLTDMGERPDGTTLDRKNNNRNYTPSNCRWATKKQQMRNSGSSKLTVAQVRQIRTLRGKGTKLAIIATQFKVTPAAISAICTGKSWA